MRIGIDAMGTDRAPVMEVEGALAARTHLRQGDRIVLVGDAAVVRKHLDAAGEDWPDHVDIHHASERIGTGEPPIEALRAKPDSSIAVLARLHADQAVQACISAGNTGAFVGAAQMRLRRLRGVNRPGIAIVLPTVYGPVAVCDAGANVSCKPHHLYQYAVMASVYVQAVCGVRTPRVGLLSVGQEAVKGNELVRQARQLIQARGLPNFVGNVEGRDLFSGTCDVVVCDGFVGNVVLKLVEGIVPGLIRDIIDNVGSAPGDQKRLVQGAAQATRQKFDFNEYGGAPLLGVGGICMICHGANDPRGMKNAVRAAIDFSSDHVNERITELLTVGLETCHG